MHEKFTEIFRRPEFQPFSITVVLEQSYPLHRTVKLNEGQGPVPYIIP
ncbi:hypothetical protein [Neobacillus piezotolerans]|nr:hypothetical protein [Neobacillus piezotolerans]